MSKNLLHQETVFPNCTIIRNSKILVLFTVMGHWAFCNVTCDLKIHFSWWIRSKMKQWESVTHNWSLAFYMASSLNLDFLSGPRGCLLFWVPLFALGSMNCHIQRRASSYKQAVTQMVAFKLVGLLIDYVLLYGQVYIRKPNTRSKISSWKQSGWKKNVLLWNQNCLFTQKEKNLLANNMPAFHSFINQIAIWLIK